MKRYVSDTQCIVWYLADDLRRLPKAARAAFKTAEDGAAQILVPSIALVEAIFLSERRRVPEEVLVKLMALPETSAASIRVVPLDMAVVRALSDFGPAAIPEIADRIIAATARALDLPLLTTDPVIEESKLVRVAK